MGKALRYLIAFLSIPLVGAFVVVALRVLSTDVPWTELQWPLLGLLGYVLMYPLLRSKNLHFVELFEHELGHMVTYLSAFYRLKEFRVYPEENKNCAIAYETGIPGVSWLTILAPYVLPVFTIPLLVIRFVIPEQFFPPLDALIGATLGFHFIALFKEFRPFQPDLVRETVVFSFVFTVFANTILIMSVIIILLHDAGMFLEYWRSALIEAGQYYEEIFQWLRESEFLSA